MVTLLCIDDTPEVQIMVRRIFSTSANVLAAGTLREGFDKLKSNNVDLILLDLSLPDGDGFDLFTKLQHDVAGSNTPIIILTSKNQIQDKVMGFHLGAEDYIVKPFDPTELKIRVESRVKRHQLAKEYDSILNIGNLSINHLEQKVTITKAEGPQVVELTTTEFKILSFLAKHKDQVLSREQIINSAWKHGFNVSDRTIDSHISRIRKKISESENTIIAIQGVGYKLSQNKKTNQQKAS